LEIRDHVPKAFAMMKNMYLHPSRVWYFDMPDEPNAAQTAFIKVMSWRFWAIS
jgi:hypothetical protein